jgi:TRAP-type mannitol/chloroaromatic compound transport system substrate-binding protein
MTFPSDLVTAAAKESTGVLADLASRGATSRKVHDSYVAFRERVSAWSKISLRAVLEARG